MICWLIIHTSNDKMDNRRYEQFRGVQLTSGQINFAKDFAKKSVDTSINDPIRYVKENECLYANVDPTTGIPKVSDDVE